MNGSLENYKNGANPCLAHLERMPSIPAGHLDFQILNAFTTDVFGGNPAVIVFLDKMLPNEVLEKINNNFNQPIVVYVSPPTSGTLPKNGCAVFGLRWFGPRNEVHICGHGTRTSDFVLCKSTNGMVL